MIKILSHLGALLIGVIITHIMLYFRNRGNPEINKILKEQAAAKNKEAAGYKAKAERIKKRVAALKSGRKKIRDKYGKTIRIILISFICSLMISSQVSAVFIIYDQEDDVYRDYGNITNYVKSLEEEKKELLAIEGYLSRSIIYYSNAYAAKSNENYLQGKLLEGNNNQESSWWKDLWETIDFPAGIIITTVLFLVL